MTGDPMHTSRKRLSAIDTPKMPQTISIDKNREAIALENTSLMCYSLRSSMNAEHPWVGGPCDLAWLHPYQSPLDFASWESRNYPP